MVLGNSGASDQVVWGVYWCVFSRRFQWDHRRPCPTSAAGAITDLVKSCFGGLRGLWSGCVGYLWMHLWMAVPMTPSAAMSDISGWRYCRFLTAAALSARTYVITWDCTHWPLYFGGRGVIKSCRLLTAAALSSRSDIIRTVFSLPKSPSLVCWIGPTAVRKKVAMVSQGRGLTIWMSSFNWTILAIMSNYIFCVRLQDDVYEQEQRYPDLSQQGSSPPVSKCTLTGFCTWNHLVIGITLLVVYS